MDLRKILWIGAGLALIATAGFAAWRAMPAVELVHGLSSWVGELGPAGVALIAVSYIVAILLLIPAAPITLLAGMVYGFWAVPLALFGTTAGGALAFLIARHAAEPSFRRVIETRPRFAAVDRAVAEEAWKIVGLLRVSSILSYALASYVFGVTSVSFGTFTAATFVGIIPGVVLYVYVGKLGQLVASGAGSPLQWALLVLALLASFAAATIIVRRAQEKLKERGVGAFLQSSNRSGRTRPGAHDIAE